MNKLIEGLKEETTKTFTENGALTYSTSLNANVDLFFMGSALRESHFSRVVDIFEKAYIEDKNIAMANLWYLRDIRGGAGERKTSSIIYKYLLENHPEEINLEKMVEYGRYEDIMFLIDSPLQDKVLSFIKEQLDKDVKSETPSLLAKWMPSYRCHDKERHKLSLVLIKKLFKNSKHYRKTLKSLRDKINIVETHLSNKEYGKIEYSKLPSKASVLYSKAFAKNDGERYSQYLEALKKGETKVNTGTLVPSDIIRKYLKIYGWQHEKIRPENDEFLNQAWNNLKDHFENNSENSLVMADTSGSMCGEPIINSISLAMYIAERNKGDFHNCFLTFSSSPSLVELKGDNIFEKISFFTEINSSNTDLEKAFDCILVTAIDRNIPESEMPKKIYIVSDMEFDEASGGKTNFETIKSKYKEVGYELPQIVFWNVNSRQNNIPVRYDEKGTALVSGNSTNILKFLINNDDLSPVNIMMNTLKNYM